MNRKITKKTSFFKWGKRISNGYFVMLFVSIALGWFASQMINEGGTMAGDHIGVISWLVLFPVYILLDAIVNARFLGCSLRAAFLPLVQGFIITKLTVWEDPFGVSQIVATIYVAGSLIIVAITRLVRRRKKRL